MLHLDGFEQLPACTFVAAHKATLAKTTHPCGHLGLHTMAGSNCFSHARLTLTLHLRSDPFVRRYARLNPRVAAQPIGHRTQTRGGGCRGHNMHCTCSTPPPLASSCPAQPTLTVSCQWWSHHLCTAVGDRSAPAGLAPQSAVRAVASSGLLGPCWASSRTTAVTPQRASQCVGIPADLLALRLYCALSASLWTWEHISPP